MALSGAHALRARPRLGSLGDSIPGHALNIVGIGLYGPRIPVRRSSYGHVRWHSSSGDESTARIEDPVLSGRIAKFASKPEESVSSGKGGADRRTVLGEEQRSTNLLARRSASQEPPLVDAENAVAYRLLESSWGVVKLKFLPPKSEFPL